MSQRIGVAKAACLLGIPRTQLQRLVRDGELHAFEGELDLDELRHRFPALALDQSEAIERAASLRESAFARRVRSEVLQAPESWERQFRQCNAELAVVHAQAKRYRLVLEDLTILLSDLCDTEDPRERDLVRRLNCWLVQKLDC